MKFVRRVSLFLVMSILLLGTGGYAALKAEQFFYPNRYQEKQEEVPVKYIGLDRESLIKELESYDRNPPLRELELGFETIELTAFSKDRVVICKYYKEETPKGYYLMVEDHFIVVYEEDKQHLHMNTDILLDDLNDSLKAEIIQGKYIENDEALYHFLESYSS